MDRDGGTLSLEWGPDNPLTLPGMAKTFHISLTLPVFWIKFLRKISPIARKNSGFFVLRVNRSISAYLEHNLTHFS